MMVVMEMREVKGDMQLIREVWWERSGATLMNGVDIHWYLLR